LSVQVGAESQVNLQLTNWQNFVRFRLQLKLAFIIQPFMFVLVFFLIKHSRLCTCVAIELKT